MNEANKDEAFRSLGIAKKARDAGDTEKARKFGEKAQQLYPCPAVCSGDTISRPCLLGGYFPT